MFEQLVDQAVRLDLNDVEAKIAFTASCNQLPEGMKSDLFLAVCPLVDYDILTALRLTGSNGADLLDWKHHDKDFRRMLRGLEYEIAQYAMKGLLRSSRAGDVTAMKSLVATLANEKEASDVDHEGLNAASRGVIQWDKAAQFASISEKRALMDCCKIQAVIEAYASDFGVLPDSKKMAELLDSAPSALNRYISVTEGAEE